MTEAARKPWPVELRLNPEKTALTDPLPGTAHVGRRRTDDIGLTESPEFGRGFG